MSTDGSKQWLLEPVTTDDHCQGPDTAPVTLVMYGDYECPHTRAAHSTIKRLRERFGDELRVVFRHFPRPEVHPHAEHAAILAEAAADRGRFWEMHDQLLEAPATLDDAVLASFAARQGLGEVRYEAGHPYATRVQEDIESGQRGGIGATPAIYINGRRHNGAFDERTLEAAIKAAR